MPKFLIEVTHAEEYLACAQVVESFLNYGSHFLPPAYRAQATIIELNKFSMAEIDEILLQHAKK